MGWSSGWGRWVGTSVISLVLVGCAAGTTLRSGQTDATPVTPPPSASAFVSDRHGYSLEVPHEWDVTEYPGTWRRLEQFNPGAEVPGEDVVSAPDVEAFLVANSMPIPEGMNAGEWRDRFDALVEEGLDPNCPGETSQGSLAGESATVIQQDCGGMTIVGRRLTHGDRGYYFTIGFPTGDAESGTMLEDILESIRFADG